jgi:hypothetical protein
VECVEHDWKSNGVVMSTPEEGRRPLWVIFQCVACGDWTHAPFDELAERGQIVSASNV